MFPLLVSGLLICCNSASVSIFITNKTRDKSQIAPIFFHSQTDEMFKDCYFHDSVHNF